MNYNWFDIDKNVVNNYNSAFEAVLTGYLFYDLYSI